MNTKRIIVLMHRDFLPPPSIEGLTDKEIAPWKTEYDVCATLDGLGHTVRAVGLTDDLGVLRKAVKDFEPHVVFNLLEEFGGTDAYVPYIIAYLELLGVRYTGCNPRGLILACNKVLSKKILRYHRVPVADFVVFPRGRSLNRKRRLPFPLFVKSATEHGSIGISRSSIVHDDAALLDRVAFIHDQLRTDAVAESYIDGRELYVGLIGNGRVGTFPLWELHFDNLPDGAPRIATTRAKWNYEYQQKIGLRTAAAADLPDGVEQRVIRVCKRAYRALSQSGYARIDIRLTKEGKAYILESNPNPQLAFGEDFAESASAAGVEYDALLQRIVNLGIRGHDTVDV